MDHSQTASLPSAASPPSPITLGLQAARANIVPGLIIQAVILAVVLGYHYTDVVKAGLTQIAGWKAAYGFLYSAAAGAIAGGIFPELLTIVVFQRGRATRRNLSNLAFTLPFWAFQAVVVDFLYRGQDLWFGSGADFCTVATKVCVDQFIFTPFICMPYTVVLMEWYQSGYRWEGGARVFSLAYHRVKTVPAVIAAWGVWLPVVSLVYSLPPLLQLPVFSLALTFWVLIITWISRSHSRESQR